ncbi:MAG: DUF86 domain-containing protein [Chloroflexi bacterium]|nr:DUF86 domain-containing protein [Chloroflexota bacterium]
MKHSRAYAEYLRDILHYATKAQDFLADTTFPEFVANEEKALAVLHALQIIGEAANRLPRRLTQQYPDVHWADITGMRNFIAHGYFHVDLEIV